MSPEYAERIFSEEYQLGILLVDPKSGRAKRPDNSKTFNLSRRELTLLRILDQKEFVEILDIAFQYEIAPLLNEVMVMATSLNGNRDHRDSLKERLDKLDYLYGKYNDEDCGKPLACSEDNIRVNIKNLRKKIGSDLIETNSKTKNIHRDMKMVSSNPNAKYGYRLRRE
jgi:hypothetical protein